MVTYKAVLWITAITTTYWLYHVKKVLIYLKKINRLNLLLPIVLVYY